MIRTETDARGVATLTLARAEKHNALSAEMIAGLTEAAQTLGADPEVRVVVLSADGRTFCAGGDLGWMRDQMEATPQDRAREARKLAEMLQVLNLMPKPLIGRVQGNAFGGGVGMACVCDTVVAVDAAKFALTETKLGLIPATIGPYVLARMGEGRARRVFMSGRVFDADEAMALGVVAKVVSPDALDEAIEAEVAPYLACAPGAVADAKTYARSLGPVIDDALIDRSIAGLMARWEDEEAQEGIGAFFDKRKPRWAK
ncbi:crotonase/enoyl-CoA hydratase family protein [Yoonia sp. 208BN28-4]|uniref:crotonase/enoyl-CoA hydratase family protein n=1 Tax=Yoonia sp. 208BN28-4 TaxID=3126505 RepID=UPI00309B22EB